MTKCCGNFVFVIFKRPNFKMNTHQFFPKLNKKLFALKRNFYNLQPK